MIRTRIAPSPTGLIHIGNIRTAIYNFLLSKNNNGEFILRIDDTDKNRSEIKFINEIKRVLKFLNIKYNKEFQQSDRDERHREIVKILLEKGIAYKCLSLIHI